MWVCGSFLKCIWSISQFGCRIFFYFPIFCCLFQLWICAIWLLSNKGGICQMSPTNCLYCFISPADRCMYCKMSLTDSHLECKMSPTMWGQHTCIYVIFFLSIYISTFKIDLHVVQIAQLWCSLLLISAKLSKQYFKIFLID